MTSDLQELYQEVILDHNKRPRNFRALADGRRAEGYNPLCGDRLTVYLRVEDGVIKARMYRVETGTSASFRVTVPPWAFFNIPEGKTFHAPLGPASKSSASVPVQYSTW